VVVRCVVLKPFIVFGALNVFWNVFLCEFVQSRQLPWLQLHDPKAELFQQLHSMGVPYCLLLDREGKVILHYARGEALKRTLEEVLNSNCKSLPIFHSALAQK